MEEKITIIQGIILVNKSHPLPSSYNPGLDVEAIKAYELMRCEATKCGFTLEIISGFRSYDYQKKIYNDYVKDFGEEVANTFSAKPGYSEHQTGLALDISEDNDNYGTTEESKWLASNSHKYGYIIRYPKGKENITGYKYEPWHIRYVGIEHAKVIYNNNITLEEYLEMEK